MEPQSSNRPARMPLGRLLSFEEQRAELKPLKRRPEDEPTLAVPQVPEETSKPVNKVKSKEAKAAKKRESKTTTTTITTSFTETRTSSVEATVVKVHGAKAESSQPPGKAAAEERQKAGGKPAEKPAIRAKPRRPSEEGAQSAEKKEAPAAKGTVLPQITGFSKLVDKVLHKGEEQQVKVKPEGGGQGGAGGDAEPGKDADDDFSNFQLDLPETSFEAEVLRHTMYAQVMKDPPTSPTRSEPELTSTESSPQKSAPPPEQAQAPAPDDDRLSKFSSFFAPKESTSSPKRGEGDPRGAPPSTETEVSPQVASQTRASPKTAKAPRIAAKPPAPPTRDAEGRGHEDSEPTRSSAPPENRKAPKPATRTSSLNPAADLKSPEEPPAMSEPPEAAPAAKPRPRPKPRDSIGPSADFASAGKSHETPRESPEPPAQPSAADVAVKSQTAPKDFGRPERVNAAAEIASRNASLPARISSQDMERGADSGEQPPDTNRKKQRPASGEGASAADDSEYDDSEDEESDEEGGCDHDDDFDSPPLPERRYRGRQGKYNEYSNVIRIDSQKLKEARIRSHSRSSVAGEVDAKKEKNSKLRNAVSMEGGLDTDRKKHKKAKKAKEAGENGEKKPRKPFSLKPFKGLFGAKKKKKEEEEEECEDNVYEVVDDFIEPKSKKKAAAAGKSSTLPTKQPKQKKSDTTTPTNTNTTTPPSPHTPLVTVDSSHGTSDIRPIGRLLQLNPDGTQLLELIRPPNGNLGVQLTQGNEEVMTGKFVSGFVDKSTEKLLSGILNVGDQILKINDRHVENCPLIEVHDIIDTQQRLKFLVYPAESH